MEDVLYFCISLILMHILDSISIYLCLSIYLKDLYFHHVAFEAFGASSLVM